MGYSGRNPTGKPCVSHAMTGTSSALNKKALTYISVTMVGRLIQSTPLILAAFLTGCTPSPVMIEAAPVSGVMFADMDCPKLVTFISDTQAGLAPIVEKQETASNAQVAATVGFGLVGMAVSGAATQQANQSGVIAQKRGELKAARERARQMNCQGVPPVHYSEVKPPPAEPKLPNQ